jgi:cytoskeleton protein RodZ
MSEAAVALGQRLKAEREKKGLSAQKAADELHLDGWVVDALESGDYARIGPPVYAKGHLKHYAGLLGLPAENLLEGYETAAAAPADAQASSLRMRTSPAAAGDLPWLPIVGFVVAALVIAGVVWWSPWHPRTADAPASLARTNPAGGAASAADPSTGPGGGDDAAGGTPAADDAATPDAATPGVATPGVTMPGVTTPGTSPVAATGGAAPPSDAAAAGSGRARLRLLFSADSWVDVRDAAGQRVFAGTGHVNNVRTIAGAAPLRVYIKSASSVQLYINNRPVVIEPQFVIDNVARFEAGADGVLRREPHPAAPPGAAAPDAPRPHG